MEEKEQVNHPSHYNSGKIEVIDYIEDLGMGKDFCLGNAIKYIARAGKKDPAKEVEDLKKAVWYIQRYIESQTKATKQKPEPWIKISGIDVDHFAFIPDGSGNCRLMFYNVNHEAVCEAEVTDEQWEFMNAKFPNHKDLADEIARLFGDPE